MQVTPQKEQDTNEIHRAVANHCLSELSFLLDSETDIEITDEDGSSPLHLAVKRNFESGINLLLEKGASVNVRDNEGSTPLHFAVVTRNFGLVQNLINKGAESKDTDMYGVTCLHIAAYNNYWEMLDVLLHSRKRGVSQFVLDTELLRIILSREYEACEESDINSLVRMKNESGKTPLHIAAQKSTFNLAGMLLDFGAEINSRDNLGLTPLHTAIENNSHQIVKLLTDEGADVNIISDNQEPLLISAIRNLNKISVNQENKKVSQSKSDKTPLIFAANDNLTLVGLVELLLKSGADPNVIDTEGYTPLDYVVKNQNFHLFQKLLDNGALLETPIHPENTAVCKMFDFDLDQTVSLILENKLDVNMRCCVGKTPLHYVSNNGALVELLLNNGADIDAVDYFGATPLCNAIIQYTINQQDVSGIEMLIKKGANVNIKNVEGKTPLHYVTNNGALVELLLNNGADIDAVDNFGATSLFNAMIQYTINQQDGSGIEMLIKKGANVNIKNGEGKTLLHYALLNRSFVDILLDKGGDIEAKDNHGKTPIFCAINMGYNAESSLENILNYGVNVNVQDNDGKTPLHYAACLANPTLVNVLLSHGANLELKDNKGQTPFFEVVTMQEGEFEDNVNSVISVLIEKGASVNTTNIVGRTVLFYEMNKVLLKKILNSGADVTIKDNNGQTALHLAMTMYKDVIESSNNVDHIIEQLIEKGANLLSQDNEGITPLQMFLGKQRLFLGSMSDIKPLLVAKDDGGNTLLHVAAKNKLFNLVKHLLDIGFRVDYKNKFGETPLHLAAGYGSIGNVEYDLRDVNYKIVRELLNRGAAINMQDDVKETPLHKAGRYKNQGVIKYLLIRGARMDIKNCMGYTPLQIYAPSEPQDNKMIEHIVIFKTANLLDDITCNVDSVDCSAFETFKGLYLNELRRLEEYKCDCLSLIDVFKKFEEPSFVSSSKLKEIITSPLLEEQFPIYGPYLKVRCEKLFNR